MIVEKGKYLKGFLATAVIFVCILFVNVCALSVDYQLYDTPFPSENYDGPATNCPATGGLLDPVSAKIIEANKFSYPAPFTMVTRDPDELYLIGGGGGDPTYIAKANPINLGRIKVTYLELGTAKSYPPSVAVHANGYIYVTAQNVCYKLDPNINVINHYILPIMDSDAVYNSMKVLSDGNVVCKGIASTYSSITLLDQDLNPLIAELVLPEWTGGRVSVHIRNDREYIYFTGQTTLVRYEYVSGANPPLVLDEGWSYKYRTGTSLVQTAGGVASFIGDNAFFVDNAAANPSLPLGPIHIIRVNLDDSSDAQTFTPFGLPRGFHFNKNLVDPVNGIIVVSDSRNKKMGGYRYLGNRQFQELWVKDIQSAIVCSASSSAKHLYASDFDKNKRRDNIVILDIETGEELRRIETSARFFNSVSGVALGWNNDIFWCGINCVARVYNDIPKGRNISKAPPESRTCGPIVSGVPGLIAPKLYANFPNPFNPETRIPYSLGTDALVSVDIYNLQGVHIRHLDLGHKPAGIYFSKEDAAYWDGRNEFGEEVPSGVYFYSIRAGDFEATRRMTILR